MKYALVQDNKIVKFKNVPAGDTLIIGKLLAHNYLIVEEQKPPVCEPCTQSLSDAYEIQEGRVLRTWIIKERPFAEAKSMKEENINSKALSNIQGCFGSPGEALEIGDILAAKNQQLEKVQIATTNQDLWTVI